MRASCPVTLQSNAELRNDLDLVLQPHSISPLFLASALFCSQELIATADADGIVRTYRPLALRDAAKADAQVLVADASAVLQFQLIVECRLGSSPVGCEFAMEKNANGEDQTDLDEWREVLRTCTKDNGRLRVWPSADLPTRPLRPLLLEPPSSPPFSSPPQETEIPRSRQDQRESEPMDRSGRQRGREEHKGREEGYVGFVEGEATGAVNGDWEGMYHACGYVFGITV